MWKMITSVALAFYMLRPSPQRFLNQCDQPIPIPVLQDSVRADVVRKWSEDFALSTDTQHVTLGPSVSGVELITVDVDGTPFRYRFGVSREGAFRLRAWGRRVWGTGCTGMKPWLESVGNPEARTPDQVWELLYDLAVVMNPVGEKTQLLDPSGLTHLAQGRTFADSFPSLPPGPQSPTLRKRPDGGYEGSVMIGWANVDRGGLALVEWQFAFDKAGHLESLLEWRAIPEWHQLMAEDPGKPGMPEN